MDHANTKFEEVSQNAFSITYTSTTEVFTSTRNELAITENQYQTEVIPEIRAMAVAAGYAVDSYDFQVFHKPRRRNISIGDAWAYLDGTTMSLGGSMTPPTSGESGIVLHEMCHLLGLRHTGFLQSDSSDPHGPGTVLEYGERDDVMGAQYRGHPNATLKYYLGWLGADAVTTASTNGIFRVFRHDHANAAGPRLLIIENSSGDDYYLDYRYERYEGSPDEESAGIRKIDGNRTILLDAHPQSSASQFDNYDDFGFRVGESFNDYGSGIKVEIISSGGTSPNKYLDVEVTFGDYSLTAPSLYTSPGSTTVIEGDVGAVLSVVGLGSQISYQWYEGASGDTSTPIAGATSNSFLVPPLSATTSYWVQLTNSAGSIDSADVQVVLEESDLPIHWLKHFSTVGIDTGISTAAFTLDGKGYFGGDNVLICYSLDDGSELWRHTDTRYGSFYHPAIDIEGNVFAGHWDGSLNAFNGSTGELLWSYNKSPWNVARVGSCIIGDLVIFQRGIEIIAVDRSDGSEVWTVQHASDATRPLTDGRSVFWAVPFSSPPMVVCAAADTGAIRWQREFSDSTLRASTYTGESLAIADDQVYVVTSRANKDQLVALDSSSGEVDWEGAESTFNSSLASHKPPIIDAIGNVYWINGLGNLVKVDPATGSIIWTVGLQTEGKVRGNLVMLDVQTIAGLFKRYIGGSPEFNFLEIDLNTRSVSNRWKVSKREDGYTYAYTSLGPEGKVYFGFQQQDQMPSSLYSIQSSSPDTYTSQWAGFQGSIFNDGKGIFAGPSGELNLTFAAPMNAQLTFFATRAHYDYSIQFSEDLSTWTPLVGFAGDDDLFEYEHGIPQGTPKGFYKVEKTLPSP